MTLSLHGCRHVWCRQPFVGVSLYERAYAMFSIQALMILGVIDPVTVVIIKFCVGLLLALAGAGVVGV